MRLSVAAVASVKFKLNYRLAMATYESRRAPIDPSVLTLARKLKAQRR